MAILDVSDPAKPKLVSRGCSESRGHVPLSRFPVPIPPADAPYTCGCRARSEISWQVRQIGST
jgi:hypothetical protein